MNNIIFYFSGTGNCLHAAKTIAKEIENCEIVSMSKPFNFTKQYERIGFVYPVYFWGLPKRTIEFVEALDLSNNKNAYFFSIATMGGDAGNAVYQMYKLLKKKHGVKLNYGKALIMFSNYVVMYNMRKNVEKRTEKSNKDLIPIINTIKLKKNKAVNKLTGLFCFVNKNFVKKVSGMDKGFTVSENCNGCGICKEVCPVNNIEMANSKPQYKHNCEQCVACIQYCPQRAINYGNATVKRGRYTHPEISYKELAKYNNSVI